MTDARRDPTALRAGLAALVLCTPMLAACGAVELPPRCSSIDATACHAHIDTRLVLNGSVSLDGEVQHDLQQGVLCASNVHEGAVWTVPFPATPTPVHGHFVSGQGSILSPTNLGPGTYAAASVDSFEVIIDAHGPFAPGSGSITIAADGSGSMQLVGFSNGNEQVNATITWSCENLSNS